MDKQEYVEKAPIYYALGIAVALLANNNKGAKSLADLDQIVEPSTYRYFLKAPVVDQALKILVEADVVEVIPDDFGPTIYRPTPELKSWTAQTNLGPFRKFAEVNSWTWLRSAIRSVNGSYDQLKITPEDFESAVVDSQWEPIPLDRNDEKLQEATKALDNAIQAIEGDNGYAVKVHAEREYVLSRLKSIRATLKEKAQVVWPELRANAIDPLARVIRRFGPAAVGVAAVAARNAIVEWLKANWSKFIDLF